MLKTAVAQHVRDAVQTEILTGANDLVGEVIMMSTTTASKSLGIAMVPTFCGQGGWQLVLTRCTPGGDAGCRMRTMPTH